MAGIKVQCLAACLLILSVAIGTVLAQTWTEPQTPSTAGPYVAVEGTTVTLSCQFIAVEPQADITWTRDNVNLPVTQTHYNIGVTIVNKGTTSIIVSRSDHLKEFICTASNTDNPTGVSAKWSFRVNVIPLEPVLTGPNSVTAGQASSWKCVSDEGNPKSSINWRLDTTALLPGITGVQRINDTSDLNFDGTKLVESTLTYIPQISDNLKNLKCEVQHETLNDPQRVSLVLNVYYPPIVSVPETVYKVLEGSRVDLQCSVTANPSADEIYWTLNGVRVQTVNQNQPWYIIQSAASSHSGTYVCVARNAYGTTNSDSVILNVEGRPSVRIPEISYTVNAISDAVIPCEIQANPAVHTVSWYKMRLGIQEFINVFGLSHYSGSTSDSPALVIHNVESSDAGYYLCKATNTLDSGTSLTGESGLTELKITYGAKNIALSTASVITPLYLESVSVTCTAEGLPEPTFSWMYNGLVYQSAATLQILNIQKEMAGTYTCIASNAIGSDTTSLLIDVQYAPSPYILEVLYNGELGGSITITCNIDANPEATGFSWYRIIGGTRQNIQIDNSKYSLTGSTSSKSILTINNLDSGDDGIYRCEATNTIGTVSSNDVQVQVNSQFQPTNVQVSFSSGSVVAGDTITLNCQASGVPTPTYQWYFEGIVSSIGSGSAYTINQVTASDYGIYSCVATNSLGTESASRLLDVQYTPIDNVQTKTVEVSTGSTVNLTCETTANPAPTSYTWTYKGTQLAATGATIEVTVLAASDYGSYQCTATNSIGTSNPITIVVAAPTGPGVGQSTTDSEWSAGAIAAVVLAIVFVLLVIIIIIVCCCLYGACGAICGKKQESKVKVTPAISAPEPQAKVINVPRFVEKTGSREPSAVSRKDVDIFVSHNSHKMNIDSDNKSPRIYVRAPGGGPIISILEDKHGQKSMPHQLPALDTRYMEQNNTMHTYEEEEKKKHRRRRKKRHHHRHHHHGDEEEAETANHHGNEGSETQLNLDGQPEWDDGRERRKHRKHKRKSHHSQKHVPEDDDDDELVVIPGPQDDPHFN